MAIFIPYCFAYNLDCTSRTLFAHPYPRFEASGSSRNPSVSGVGTVACRLYTHAELTQRNSSTSESLVASSMFMPILVFLTNISEECVELYSTPATLAAKFITTSTLLHALVQFSCSRRSVLSIWTFRWIVSRFFRDPDSKESATRTLAPDLTSCSTRWEPMNPAPPATRTTLSPQNEGFGFNLGKRRP